MTNAALRVFVLSSMALGAAAALAVPPVAAQSRVGVTSATSGDPLGKPPAMAERVLHVGVDVQANEAITTGASDRAHLLFLDGSSLTVGPQARLTIDKFVFDPQAKVGALAVTATQGVFRFVGGKISKIAPVTITTPSATMTIRGGIMIVSVEPARTVATFVFGNEMTVTAHGQMQTVTRPGWQVTILMGDKPGQPVQVPPGSLAAELKQLEGEGAQPGSGDADRQAETSGFSGLNSGLGTSGGGGGTDQGGGSDAINAISGSNTQLQRQQPPPTTPTFVPPPVSSGGGRSRN
ncbi:MAG: FecR domain-containing protein [Reyranellales bacterium]